jgi:hypothetical protein
LSNDKPLLIRLRGHAAIVKRSTVPEICYDQSRRLVTLLCADKHLEQLFFVGKRTDQYPSTRL